MIPIFYTPPEKIVDMALYIDGVEARHLRDVMRLEKGEVIIVVDGIGNGYRCEISELSKSKVDCTVVHRIRHFGEPLHFVTLAAGLSTGFKFDEVIQRATELGVCRFIPMRTEKSKVKIDDEKRQKTKMARWNKVAIASMKQTGRSFLPDISPITRFKEMFELLEETDLALLFDPAHADSVISDIKFDPEAKACNIIIGPESGFSRDEIEIAREHNCHVVSMGKRILRTENASPIAVALVMNLLGELR